MGITDWHEAWTAVATPAVVEAVRQLGLRPGARVLDVGTGGGVALTPLADVVGTSGTVVAVDADVTAVDLARRRIAATGVAKRVDVRHARIEELLDASKPETFDAIWAGDVLWHNYFTSPSDVVSRLATLLVRGGVLAVFSGNWYSSRFLSGYPALERQVLEASACRWRVPNDGVSSHHEMVGSWLTDAALHDVRVSVHPIVGTRSAENWPAWQRYLEVGVWPDYLAAVREHGAAVGIGDDRAQSLTRLITTASPSYVVNGPGYVAFQPTLLVCGVR